MISIIWDIKQKAANKQIKKQKKQINKTGTQTTI